MKCTKCDTEFTNDSKFCPKCGTKIEISNEKLPVLNETNNQNSNINIESSNSDLELPRINKNNLPKENVTNSDNSDLVNNKKEKLEIKTNNDILPTDTNLISHEKTISPEESLLNNNTLKIINNIENQQKELSTTNNIKPNNNLTPPEVINKSKINNLRKIISNKKIIIIVALISILVLTIFLFLIFGKPKRQVVLTNISSSKVKFKIGEEEFQLGDTINDLKSKGFTIDEKHTSDNDFVTSDSILLQNIYNKNKAQFLAVIYCSSKEDCKYEDTNVIKITFYQDSDVVVNDFLKFGLSYDEVKEKYGKEDGKYKEDKNYLIWTFGEKGAVGEPYYMIKFSDSLFSSGEVEDIRIGVWWYEDEYEHTVK